MDVRERYDPEDLEVLLSERAFDELLAEERAFVLRHVADRAEYESLRATLAQVRAHGRPGPPLAADPEVRDRVLTAFRAARRPAWRIWLNSVGAWLMPPRPALYWRPAVAFGALALLIAVGLSVLTPVPGVQHEGLAELKPPPPQQDGADTRQNLEETPAQVPTAAEAGSTTAPPATADQAPARTGMLHTAVSDADLEGDAMAEVPAEEHVPVKKELEQVAAATALAEPSLAEQQAAHPVAAVPPGEDPSGRAVREVNDVTLSSTGSAKLAKASMDGEASASLAGGNADLRGLMRAAW